MKRRATLLLVAASVWFVITRYFEPRLSVAGHRPRDDGSRDVGGLADWFAVTALFRHPLGIPIPHTAIVPAKKDRVGRTLGAFVQRNFLSRDVIEHRMRSMQVGRRLAEWFASPENARTISEGDERCMSSAAQMLQGRRRRRRSSIDRSRERRADDERRPHPRESPAVITEDNRHQEVLDEVLRLASRTVNDNADVIRQRIERETPWWIPSAVDDKIFKRVLGGIQKLLSELSADPQHQLRQKVRRVARPVHRAVEHVARVRREGRGLEGGVPRQRSGAEVFVVAVAGRQGSAREVRRAIQVSRAQRDRESAHHLRPKSARRSRVAREARRVCDRRRGVSRATVSGRSRRFDRDTVAAWDPELTSRRVELAIGRDLQFIRINGTIVGGLAGMVIYLISSLFP